MLVMAATASVVAGAGPGFWTKGRIAEAALAAMVLPVTESAGPASIGAAAWVAVGLGLGFAALCFCADLGRGQAVRLVGVASLAMSLWVSGQRDDGPMLAAFSLTSALALSLALRTRPADRRDWAVIGGVGMALLGLRAVSYPLAETAAMALVIAAVVSRWRVAPARSAVAVATVTVVATTLFAAYVGANNPDASWFGSVTSHGSRDNPTVALTFDDGPGISSMAIAKVLDSYGVKGTFFEVGKALDARPDIARQLLDDGQLLANHSYEHDGWRWLDPRYPELQRTQNAFNRNLGVCPTFYRPPHGQHTPFTSHVVGNHAMRAVTWDLGSGDWNANLDQARDVADRVLAKVRPGSIILMHDSLDGLVNVDRSVTVRALPFILEGLKQRGLTPVTLDVMFKQPGYGDHC
jgi:peptidoglycan/xylan/chitin deacetylase (PgdA/CDA1 family)